MSSFWTSNSFNYSSSLFNNYSSNNQSTGTGLSGLTGLLGDYSSIKSGTYKKLLTEYYKKNPVEKENSSNNKDVVNDTSTELTAVKGDAATLQESAAALRTRGDKSVFELKTVKTTDKDTGVVTETKEYDRDAIEKAVSAFVKDYNALLSSAGDLDTTSILRRTVSMTSDTRANEKLLKEVGITIGKDNTLSVDKEKLKEADVSKLKSIFNGSGSFADRVYEKARQINVDASMAAAKSAKTYNGKANYNMSTGSLYNGLF